MEFDELVIEDDDAKWRAACAKLMHTHPWRYNERILLGAILRLHRKVERLEQKIAELQK